MKKYMVHSYCYSDGSFSWLPPVEVDVPPDTECERFYHEDFDEYKDYFTTKKQADNFIRDFEEA